MLKFLKNIISKPRNETLKNVESEEAYRKYELGGKVESKIRFVKKDFSFSAFANWVITTSHHDTSLFCKLG